jgi:8-oxo-dGTP diphosphatase
VEPVEILGVYSDPKRDPRGHTISIAFIGKITGGAAKAGDDASSIEWISVNDNELQLAFDHRRILQDYRHWRKSKGTYWSSKSLDLIS